MPTDPANRLIDHLYRCILPRDGEGQADGELLARFVERYDEAALAAIVRRHAGMVWGVCTRALRNRQDAEDAFQATFLVLVRKASSVLPREMVGNWLYGVANQVTAQAKRGIARRRAREVQVADMPDTPATRPGLTPDLRIVLDEELVGLPDIYRAVVVLCDLEGRTRKEVARLLGVPEGTVGGRLARARALLAERLTRRGVVFSCGSAAAALSVGSASASAPPAPVASTIKAAIALAAGKAATAGAISVQVAALTEGVIKAMFVTKFEAALCVVAALAVLATGAAILPHRAAAGQDDKRPAAEKPVDPTEPKVAAPVPVRRNEKKELTAWGKEIGGLQAGLGYKPGEKRVRRPGETVELVVRVRNVGKEAVSFQCLRHFFIENPPTVTDDKGKAVAFKDGSARGIYKPVSVTLAPGKGIDLYELSLTLGDKADDTPQASTLYGEGKFQLQYERVLGDSMLSSVSIETDPALRKLATGKLDLVVSKRVRRAAAGQEGKGNKAPGKAAVLTRLKGRWTLSEVSQPQGNRKLPHEEGLSFEFAGTTFHRYQSDKRSGDGAVEVDSARNPPHLRLRFRKPDGEFSGAELAGPMEFRPDDELWIAIPDTSIRPTAEAVLAGQARVVWKLKRTPAALTAWGKEVDGLQAGLGFPRGGQRAYRPGETVTLVLRLRNAGKKEETASYYKEFFDLNQPAVTRGGKPVDLTGPGYTGQAKLLEVRLPPGEEVVLGEIRLRVGPPIGEAKGKPAWILPGPGDFQIQYPLIGGNSRVEKGQFDLKRLATGKLELEVEND